MVNISECVQSINEDLVVASSVERVRRHKKREKELVLYRRKECLMM